MKYEEAIKLKPGTPIVIRSKVVSVDATGDIVYETRAHNQEYEVMYAKTDHRYVDIQVEETDEYKTRKYTVHAVSYGSGKIDSFVIRRGAITVAAFFCDNDKELSKDEARIEAEYECDRLNDDWRKERKND